jgi:putative oxidoreductase
MRTAAILIGRLIFAGVFAMAAGFKFTAMGMTANEIAGAGFPLPHLLAWLAAIFEVALALAFLTGALFT